MPRQRRPVKIIRHKQAGARRKAAPISRSTPQQPEAAGAPAEALGGDGSAAAPGASVAAGGSEAAAGHPLLNLPYGAFTNPMALLSPAAQQLLMDHQQRLAGGGTTATVASIPRPPVLWPHQPSSVYVGAGHNARPTSAGTSNVLRKSSSPQKELQQPNRRKRAASGSLAADTSGTPSKPAPAPAALASTAASSSEDETDSSASSASSGTIEAAGLPLEARLKAGGEGKQSQQQESASRQHEVAKPRHRAKSAAAEVTSVPNGFGAPLAGRGMPGPAIGTEAQQLLLQQQQQRPVQLLQQAAAAAAAQQEGSAGPAKAAKPPQRGALAPADLAGPILLCGKVFDGVDAWGRSPIHVAAASGRGDMVQQLLYAGCDVGKWLPEDYR